MAPIASKLVDNHRSSGQIPELDPPSRTRSISEPDINEAIDRASLTQEVSDKWQPEIVLGWLSACNSAHQSVCGDEGAGQMPAVSRLRLINVHTESIIESPADPTYIALSYVWQKDNQNGLKAPANHGYISRLPRLTPPLIRDTIEVCKQLGIDFLWVDKYCVDQSDEDALHHQVHQMDRIYHNSELTIIAAYGDDERDGIPGVSAKRATLLKLHVPKLARTQSVPASGFIKNRSLIHDKHTPVSTISDLQDIIQSCTTWSTRGWTLQEAFLSRRCLVFTEEQLYFECRGGFCRYEADPAGLQQAGRPTTGIFQELEEDPEKRLDDYCLSHFSCIQKYSKRDLTKPTDALHAFAGIVSRYQKLAPRIRHMAGVPFVLSPTPSSSKYEIIDDFSRDLPRVHLAYSLGWASRHSAWDKAHPRRRPQFPSYSPFGWEGEVSNTWWGSVKLLAFDAFIGEVLVEDASGHTTPYQEAYAAMTRREANTFVPAAIHIPSVAVPQGLVDFEWVQHTLEWSVCGHHARLRLCQGASDPSEFGRALRRKDFTVILLGGRGWWDSISEQSLLLVLSPRSDHWVRVGSMLVDCGLEALCQHLKCNDVDTGERALFRLK